MADIPSTRLSSAQAIGGAIKLNGLQNGWQFTASSAYPGETTVVYSITTTLAQALSVDVPAGKQLLLDFLGVTSGLSTTQLLTIELEIDGATVISGAVTPSSAQMTFAGRSDGSDSISNRLLVNSNFKLRIRTATTTQSNINFRYRYYLV